MAKKRRPIPKKRKVRRGPASAFVVRAKMVHESMKPEEEAICRFSYKRVGRLISNTYEQWELGFLKDTSMVDELTYWLKVSGFIEHLEIDNDGTIKTLAGQIVSDTLPTFRRSQFVKFNEEVDNDVLLSQAFDEAGLGSA